LTIGEYNGASPNVYIADLRITTGAGLYTGSTSSYATFTVPSAPLGISSSGTTQFLLRAGQNSPTIQNGALTFDRGLKQYLNFGPQTFNFSTRGFTILFRYSWTGVAANNERIIQFTQSTSSPNNSFAVLRTAAGSTLSFSYYNNLATPTTVTTTGTLSQSTVYVLALVYSGSTIQWWLNGSPNASGTLTLSSDPGIFTSTFVGCDHTSTANCISMSSNTLAVYNRALSNTEIYNSYLALAETPLQPQNATLEIGDVNSTPALRVTGDGRVQLQTLGASSNVLPWPPAAMTGYVTSINGGIYRASASGDNSAHPAWTLFDKSTGYWYDGTGGGQYNTSSPYGFIGTASTTDVNGTVYNGEWFQIQMPNFISLSSYSYTGQATSTNPGTWSVLGSRDGVNWVLVDQRNYPAFSSGNGPFTFQVSTSQAFSYWRTVITYSSGSSGYLQLTEWTLYGTADLQQPLTVTQPVTLTYGAQTASLTGIANPGVFVPQDFSSSALNIPAYVVSNTVTVANTVAYSAMGPFAGEGSLYFPGGTGAYVNFPAASTPLWPGGGGLADGTIEMWVYLTQSPTGTNSMFFDRSSPSASGVCWWFGTTAGQLKFQYNNGTVIDVTAGTVSYNSWNHVAVTVKSNIITVFLNGAPGSTGTFSGSLTGSSSYSLYMSQYINPATSIGQTVYGYIACARIISGTALYTSSFTPPTGPLQPIQGVTQTSNTYGTVLLLRNAPVPGRVLTQKFAGVNSFTGPAGSTSSANSLAFPPAAMTGYATSLSSGYGQGTYVASASQEYSGSLVAWQAFDKNASTGWATFFGSYVPPAYQGSNFTVDVTGTSYGGEWIQLQMPSSVVVSSYTLTSDGNYTKMPSKWFLLCSRDGTNWYLVDQRSGQSWTSAGQAVTYTVTSAQAFTYFRIVINQCPNGLCDLGDITYNASIEGVNVSADGRLGVGVTAPVQALEVAGSAVVAGTVSSGTGFMFRNRFVNGNFNVWQRGTTFTSISTSVYTVDRWCTPSNAGTSTVIQSTNVPFRAGFQYAVSIAQAVGGSPALLEQRIEQLNTYDLYQGTPITVSFWAIQTVGTPGFLNVEPLLPTGVNTGYSSMTDACTPGNKSFLLTSSWQYFNYTFTIASTSVATNGLVVQFWQPSAVNPATILITGVQLEKGTVATPFEYRPYATELALCQRYYEIGTSSIVFSVSGAAQTTSSSFFYKITKRTATTPVLSSSSYYNSSGGGQSGTSSFYTTSTDSFNIQLNTNAATWGQIIWNTSAEL